MTQSIRIKQGKECYICKDEFDITNIEVMDADSYEEASQQADKLVNEDNNETTIIAKGICSYCSEQLWKIIEKENRGC